MQFQTPNVSITRPPTLPIRDDFTKAQIGKFRTAYLPPKAGRVNAWLGGRQVKITKTIWATQFQPENAAQVA